MATAPSPPILVWTPGGGVSGGPISNPPVYSQSGVTKLVIGQSYVDVVFGSTQTTSDWVLVACDVDNTTDVDPLNIWPGIITNRTTAGFRLQLNGMPDSGNYYLHWAVSGVNIAPSPASSYYLTGPSSGGVSVASTFTVALPPSTTLSGTLTVTPSDGGAGGVFSPSSVALSTTTASATFTYTPASYGAITLSVTNSGTLSNPASIVFTVMVTTYTFTGPASGAISVASTIFTVALPVGGPVTGTVTVTPADGGAGGTFAPTTVNLTTGASSATFTYTPASYGAKTLSVTNNGGLTDPGNLTYTSVAATYTMTGPTTGLVGVASTNFTVALPAGGVVVGTATITPSSGGGGGTFTPTTVGLTTAAPSATFTYTPASSGTKTISVTNSAGMTNPANISYSATAPFDPTSVAGLKLWLKADSMALADGTGITAWNDSSSNAYNLTVGTATFKTGITPSGKPVVRFNGTSDHLGAVGSIGALTTYTIFMVFKAAVSAQRIMGTTNGVGAGSPQIIVATDASGHLQFYAGAVVTGSLSASGTFHSCSLFNFSSVAYTFIDGVADVAGVSAGTNGVNIMNLGSDSGTPSYSNYTPCDIAEVLVYNTTLAGGDQVAVEGYLRTKYGTP